MMKRPIIFVCFALTWLVPTAHADVVPEPAKAAPAAGSLAPAQTTATQAVLAPANPAPAVAAPEETEADDEAAPAAAPAAPAAPANADAPAAAPEPRWEPVVGGPGQVQLVLRGPITLSPQGVIMLTVPDRGAPTVQHLSQHSSDDEAEVADSAAAPRDRLSARLAERDELRRVRIAP
jgi:hypothetical protein